VRYMHSTHLRRITPLRPTKNTQIVQSEINSERVMRSVPCAQTLEQNVLLHLLTKAHRGDRGATHKSMRTPVSLSDSVHSDLANASSLATGFNRPGAMLSKYWPPDLSRPPSAPAAK